MEDRSNGLGGRVALVVGGFGGIGTAITAALHAAGAHVVVAGRTPARNRPIGEEAFLAATS